MLNFFSKHIEQKFRQHVDSAELLWYAEEKNRIGSKELEAIKELELALRIKPESYETWHQLGLWSASGNASQGEKRS